MKLEGDEATILVCEPHTVTSPFTAFFGRLLQKRTVSQYTLNVVIHTLTSLRQFHYCVYYHIVYSFLTIN